MTFDVVAVLLTIFLSPHYLVQDLPRPLITKGKMASILRKEILISAITTPFAIALITALLTGAPFTRKALTVWIVLAMIFCSSNLESPRFLDFKMVTSLFIASFSFKSACLNSWTVCFEKVGYVSCYRFTVVSPRL